MSTKTTLPISEARKRIFKIAEEVQRPARHYTLTEKGKPKVVVMSAEEYDSWQETLEVMRDLPNLEKEIKKTEKEYKDGSFKTLEEILAEEGFVLANKSKRKYASGGTLKNSRERS